MYCEKCGTEISEDMNYCPVCGKEIGEKIVTIENDRSKETISGGNNAASDILLIMSIIVSVISGIALVLVPEMAKADDWGTDFWSSWAYTYQWGGDFTLICGAIFAFSLILAIVVYAYNKR